MIIKPIAKIYTGFPEKFGIPRQSGLAQTQGRIVFEKEYRNPEAFRGLEGYSHLWLIWEFSQCNTQQWTPMVRPPRLGGNKRMGVFATRSPFRPNSLGLSSVKLDRISFAETDSPLLYVTGADLADGTPIYDIKPYLAYTDSHPEAVCGFADEMLDYSLKCTIPDELAKKIEPKVLNSLIDILKNDPRPAYQNDPERIYKMSYCGYEVEFNVGDDEVIVRDVK